MVGHFLSAIIGVSTGSVTPLSVSMSIVTMQFTKKVHLLVMQQHLLPLQVPQKLKL
ncbi:MAG: HPP family protein [Flavobacterium sp.]